MGPSPNQDKGAQSHHVGVSRSALQRINTVGPQHFTENFLPQSGSALQGRVIKGLTLLSPLLLLLSFSLSIVVLAGWLRNIDMLKHLLYNQVTGFPTVFWLAFTSLAAAPAVLNWQGNKFVRALRIIARIALCVAFLCGLALWLEHLLAQDWNLNYPIFQPPGDAPPLTLPGSAPVDVSFCIVLTSLTALMLDLFAAKKPLIFQTMSLLMALPSFILVLACLFGVGDAVDVFCAYQGCVRFKYLNYTILFCLHTAIFLARPSEGITSLLAMDSQGGRQIRLSIVAVLLMIPVACVLLAAKRNELVNEPTAIVLGLISFILTAGLLGAYGARKIDKIDLEKQATEQSLQELSAVSDSQFIYKTLCLECGREFADGYENCPYDNAPLTRLLDKLATGSVFADKYEIGESLGSGGMSTVYKAQHLFLDKIVAIKLLNQQLTSDIKSVQRFQLEAKAAFNLSHPNLLGVYDFGLSRDGQAYIVMDYLEGESLSEIIRRDKRVSLTRALPIFLDICRGLQYAHEQGVLHRDIKPSNIMVLKTADGKETAKIVDFGLAKVIDENAMKMTQTGEIYGSPLYMSPEQCRGLPLDQRTDLYSLGVLMYETLSGHAPITGKGVYDTFNRKLTETPAAFAPPLMVPEGLEQLIFSLLKPQPEARPANARYLVTNIGKFIK